VERKGMKGVREKDITPRIGKETLYLPLRSRDKVNMNFETIHHCSEEAYLNFLYKVLQSYFNGGFSWFSIHRFDSQKENRTYTWRRKGVGMESLGI